MKLVRVLMHHPYESLTLFNMGLILGLWLVGFHALLLMKPYLAQDLLQKFPRNQTAGQILLGIGFAWFWLLIAPSGLGMLSSLAMDLGEFNGAKPIMRILVPVALVLVCISVRDFLSVRALGVLGLMVASPLLESAFLKDPTSRLLIPIYTYLLLTASLFWVGMPYLFRNAVTWVTESQKRWNAFSLAGLGYGIAVLFCAFVYWQKY